MVNIGIRGFVMALKIWLDGKLLDEADAKGAVFDHGLLYGDGVFEGIRVYGNDRVFLSCAPPGETGG